jgi:hypothetical protein
MTTNLTEGLFAEAMGDRVADRILRGDWGVWCSLPGRSLRAKRRRP